MSAIRTIGQEQTTNVVPEIEMPDSRPHETKPKPKLIDPPQRTKTPESEKTTTDVRPKTGKFLGFEVTIVPDDFKGPIPKGPWIKAKEIAKWEALYQRIESGSGVIQIFENSGSAGLEDDEKTPYKDPDNPNSGALIKASTSKKNARDLEKINKQRNDGEKRVEEKYPGFKVKVLKMFRKILTGPSGRKLIEQLMTEGQTLQIRPQLVENPTTHWVDKKKKDAGKPTGSVIFLHPNLSDTTSIGRDAQGKLTVKHPAFIILGHELVHANHLKLGQNKSHIKLKTDDKQQLPDREEVNTQLGPSPGGVTENDLRREHNLPLRSGLRGKTLHHYNKNPEGNEQGG